MRNDRQYYGLVSALPAQRLDKCPAPPWTPLWQSAAPFVNPDTQALLSGIYLPYEHLPLLLGRLPQHHPYPLQHREEQLSKAQGLLLPYINKADLLALREAPLADGLAQLQGAWEAWLRSFEVELLDDYLDFSKEIAQYQLQWEAAEQEPLQDLLHAQEMPPLSALEAALEQRLMPGELQQLVHSSSPAAASRQADLLRWRWLEDQVFHAQFGLAALIAYALRQQLSWQWYAAADFDARALLETTVHEMLT